MRRSVTVLSPLQLGQYLTGRSGSSYLLQRLLYERDDSPYKVWVAKYIAPCFFPPIDFLRKAKLTIPQGHELQHSPFIRKPLGGIDGKHALVFPYYTEDLLSFVKKAIASKKQIKSNLFDSLRGIRDLHKQHWTHGDKASPKPHVILMAAGKAVEILSSVISDTEDAAKVLPDECINGIKLGNVYWRSPEANFAKNIDHKTDIFSFGSVVIFALSGRAIFAYDALTEGQTPEIAVVTNQLSYFGHNITKDFVTRFDQATANSIVDILKSISSRGRQPFANFSIEGLNSSDREFIEKIMILDPSARPEAEELLDDPWWNI